MLVFSLAACAGSVTDSEYPLEFTGQIDVTYSSSEYLIDAVYSSGNLELKFIEPESLKGFIFVVGSDGVSVSRDSLELTYDPEMIETICPLSTIFYALEYINSVKPEYNSDGDYICSEFSVEGKDCKVYLNKDDYNLAKISTEDFLCNFNYVN